MANFGVILLECETLIKEAQTSRDKQAVLDKAVTDAQALVDRCKAFAGKNKQALMLAKVQEDDVKRKAAVRDEERTRGQQMEHTLNAKLSELHGMASSVDAGLKSKLDGLQHRANDLKHYHGSASNVPGLTANEIMRLATATEAKSAAAAPTLAPPMATRGASDGTLLVSPRQKESQSVPSSPVTHHQTPPASPAHQAPATPASPAPAVTTKSAAEAKGPTAAATKGPMLGTNSPRSVTMYGTMRALSAPREPRNAVVKTPAVGSEAPAAAPEVKKTWNRTSQEPNRPATLKSTPTSSVLVSKTGPATLRPTPTVSLTPVTSPKKAEPTPAAAPTVAVSAPTIVEPATPAAATPAPAATPTPAPAATAASATTPASPKKEPAPIPKFNLVVEEETTVVSLGAK